LECINLQKFKKTLEKFKATEDDIRKQIFKIIVLTFSYKLCQKYAKYMYINYDIYYMS
jgi:hypothetical protein